VVEVTVDASGHVASATVLAGPPPLQAAALDAARRARFPATLLSGKRHEVRGTLTYDF
jgi:TonB family protein